MAEVTSVLETPWSMSTSADLAFRETRGERLALTATAAVWALIGFIALLLDRQLRRHLHSMTRSARFSISAGTVTPSSRAVWRLITSWCFEKTSIAVSAGFAPLRILSTYTGTRGYVDV